MGLTAGLVGRPSVYAVLLAGSLFAASCAPVDSTSTGAETAAVGTVPTPEESAAVEIEPLSADEVLRRMSQDIASMNGFTLRASVDYEDVPIPATKVTYAGELEIAVARPDRLYLNYEDDLGAKRIWIAEGEENAIIEEGIAESLAATNDRAALLGVLPGVFEGFEGHLAGFGTALLAGGEGDHAGGGDESFWRRGILSGEFLEGKMMVLEFW